MVSWSRGGRELDSGIGRGSRIRLATVISLVASLLRKCPAEWGEYFINRFPGEYDDTDLLYIHRLNKAEEWWVSRFPHRLDLFVPDSDELYFFDTSSRDEQGEFPIMCYDLMNELIDTYASTFAEFLERLIDERS